MTEAAERYPELAWQAEAEAISCAVLARDLALDRGDRDGAAAYAAQARVAIAAVVAAGVSVEELADELGYPGGAAALDSDHIDDLVRPGWRAAQQLAIDAAREYIADDLTAGERVEVRVNRDGALAMRAEGDRRWAVASADHSWPPHAVDDDWFTSSDWREVTPTELDTAAADTPAADEAADSEPAWQQSLDAELATQWAPGDLSEWLTEVADNPDISDAEYMAAQAAVNSAIHGDLTYDVDLGLGPFELDTVDAAVSSLGEEPITAKSLAAVGVSAGQYQALRDEQGDHQAGEEVDTVPTLYDADPGDAEDAGTQEVVDQAVARLADQRHESREVDGEVNGEVERAAQLNQWHTEDTGTERVDCVEHGAGL